MVISEIFNWDDKNAPQLFASLKGLGITLDDLPGLLNTTPEEVEKNLMARPELKIAYDMGGDYIKRKIVSSHIARAMDGNIQAQQYVLKNYEHLTDSPDIFNAFEELSKATNASEISLALRKPVVKALMSNIKSNTVSPSDLIKLLGMINDRIDGKVADTMKIEMTSSEEALQALKELVEAGTITVDAAKAEAELLGIVDMGPIEEIRE